jgi:hypothetical protein
MELEINTSHNTEAIKNYWLNLYGTENLNDDETIRIVPQIKKANGEKLIFTSNVQINSVQKLLENISKLDGTYGFGNVGYSISGSIFKYDPNNVNDKGQIIPPNMKTFLKTKNIVVDIDFHIHGTKDRFILGFLDKEYIEFAALNLYVFILEKLKDAGIKNIVPNLVGMTGSGLQMVFELNKEINKEEVTIFFNYIKNILGGAKRDLLLKDQLGNMARVTADVDTTFADPTHVQRLFGTINQKYGVLAKQLDLFNLPNSSDPQDPSGMQNFYKTLIEKAEVIRKDYIQFINESRFHPDIEVKYKTYIDKIFDRFSMILTGTPDTKINIDEYINLAKVEKFSKSSSIKPSELKNIESDLLYKIKDAGINTVDLIREDVHIDHESSTFIALKCPFHEDTKYSFAIYINNNIDIMYDFHDSKSYTLITFWEKFYNVSKTTAVSQIAQKAGIKLGKTDRKDYQDLEIEEVVDNLLDKVNTDDYIYYRLANKNRVCIVRHKDTGEAFIFDGPKMLANHVLQQQLNVDDADYKFVEKFQQRFQEKIIIDAFEEFHPGKPTVFKREFIQFVNLWVPSKNYKIAHEKNIELNEKYGKIDLRDSIAILKERTPWVLKYLTQIAQQGNLLWFINWMAAGARFKTMPTIPIVFGTPGVGKNLFINTIMEWYHNSEYTKVLNSDRVMSNFNSMLEDASLIVLDEGDFATSKDFDALKFLSGNSKIAIEKKGVDAQMKDRFFNIILFSNGDVPVRHGYDDRRLQYFYTTDPLLKTVKKWGVDIEEFIEKVKLELEEFWGILLNINIEKRWEISNEKDKLFTIQILKQHSFGELILKLLKGEWKDIALQLNENIQDPSIMKANLDLLKDIKDQFNKDSKISLTLINRYLNALNFKYKTSVQRFISQNNLEELGISIDVGNDEIKIKIDKIKLLNLTKVPNLLNSKEYCEKIEELNEEDKFQCLRKYSKNILRNIEIITNVKSDFIKEEKEIEKVVSKVKIASEVEAVEELPSLVPSIPKVPKVPDLPEVSSMQSVQSVQSVHPIHPIHPPKPPKIPGLNI